MKKYILSVVLISFVLLIIGCKKAPTETSTDNLQPGKRSYIWSVDTISSPQSIQTYLTTIWGSNPKDVWIAGHNADHINNVYHFDGKIWEPVTNIPLSFSSKNYYSIKGTDAKHVYFFGEALYQNSIPPPNLIDSSLIVFYNGDNYTLIKPPPGKSLVSADIISINDIWCGGGEGTLFHYDGEQWEKNFFLQKNWLINNICGVASDDIFLTIIQKPTSDDNNYYEAQYLSHFDGVRWSVIDSNIYTNNYTRTSFPLYITKIQNEFYGSGEKGITKWDGNSWKTIADNYQGIIEGTSSKNIFLASKTFGMLHYNGVDWYRFYDVPIMNYFGLIVFDNEVFIISSDLVKTFVIHGVLR